MPAPIPLPLLAARRFARLATGLIGSGYSGLPEALLRLGYVQIDPLNVCGRMHELILRNRISGYQEGALHRFIHGSERPGFEHYLPETGVLACFTRDAWPFLQRRMQERREGRGYSGVLSQDEERLAKKIIKEIEARGPLMSDDLVHHGRAMTAWGTEGRAAKIVLDKLFAHGRVLISERRAFRRVYDLPERVLSGRVLDQPEATAEETERWAILLRLRQRRLVALKKQELNLVGDLVLPLKIDDGSPLYCLKEDEALVELSKQNGDANEDRVQLIAPLDPVIYDRKLTERLWNFSYTWEVYVPASKRVRGYYVLPVLRGSEFLGHVEPRANREAGKLEVVSKKVKRGSELAPALKELGAFLGLK